MVFLGRLPLCCPPSIEPRSRWAQHREARVTSERVVEALDVTEEREPRLVARGEGATLDELVLDRRDAALGAGIVPGVALRAHAGHDPRDAQRPAHRDRGVLRATVRVVHEARLGLAA